MVVYETSDGGSNPLEGTASASLAQLVEHLPCKQRVAGSIPVGGSSFICIFAPAKNHFGHGTDVFLYNMLA